MKAVTTFPLPEAAVALLSEVATVAGPEGWRDELAEADALLCLLTDRVDAALLERAPRLRIVANAVVGYEHVDVRACAARGIVVTHTPDVLTEATADLTWALILATVRRLPQAERSLRAGEFHGWGFWDYLGGDLAGATLGIFGMGRIGRARWPGAPGPSGCASSTTRAAACPPTTRTGWARNPSRSTSCSREATC
jgi:glyoxylate reductase